MKITTEIIDDRIKRSRENDANNAIEGIHITDQNRQYVEDLIAQGLPEKDIVAKIISDYKHNKI